MLPYLAVGDWATLLGAMTSACLTHTSLRCRYEARLVSEAFDAMAMELWDRVPEPTTDVGVTLPVVISTAETSRTPWWGHRWTVGAATIGAIMLTSQLLWALPLTGRHRLAGTLLALRCAFFRRFLGTTWT